MKNRRFIVAIAVILVFIVIISLTPIGEFALWQIDQARSFDQQRTVFQDRHVTISLVQRADVDFYNTSFLVTRPDGTTSEVLVDCDDARWWGIDIRREGSRYIVSGGSPWHDLPESHFDSSSEELFSGYYRRYHSLDGTLLRQE